MVRPNIRDNTREGKASRDALTAVADVEHGASFKKRAKLVCRYHGWDEGAF